jgi:pre-mRNA-splicing factor CWC22
LFAIRKARFADHPGVLPELDIVREDDRITHEISLEDEFTPEEECNLFQMDPNYE